MSESYNLTCERCGSAYTTEIPDNRFCSKRCKDQIGNGAPRKNSAPKYLDNGCTLRFTLLEEATSIFYLKGKASK